MIYTRSYGKPSRSGIKYSPPPGYDGSAISQTPDVKLHEAEDDVTNLRTRRGESRELPEESTDIFEERPPHPEEIPDHPERAEDSPRPQTLPEPDFGAEPGKLQNNDSVPVFENGIQAFETLFRHLRGKFGREELIIVLVMLLISSEGASVELMLLALILIAG
ncbi:MAG: hypothetical protein IJV76_05230 [Clostridia bacterium]|nr:hypothetical protein [Clostridia bacterium]